jgi:hypothetical protein
MNFFTGSREPAALICFAEKDLEDCMAETGNGKLENRSPAFLENHRAASGHKHLFLDTPDSDRNGF